MHRKLLVVDVSFLERGLSKLQRQSRARAATTSLSSTIPKSTKEFVALGNIQNPLVVVTASRKNDNDNGITETDDKKRMKTDILYGKLWIVGPVWFVPFKAYASDVLDGSLISSIFTVLEKIGTTGLFVVCAVVFYFQLNRINEKLDDAKKDLEKKIDDLKAQMSDTKKDLEKMIDDTKNDLEKKIEKVNQRLKKLEQILRVISTSGSS